jgi:cell division protein ZapA
MNTGRNVYEVQIAGIPLKLRSSHDQETVNQLAAIVDSRLRQTLEASPAISFQNALILTALNLAEDHTLLKRAALRELAAVESRAQKILETLEETQVPQSTLDV